jgi:hypothetical protein
LSLQLERPPLHEYLERPEDAELDFVHQRGFTTVAFSRLGGRVSRA